MQDKQLKEIISAVDQIKGINKRIDDLNTIAKFVSDGGKPPEMMFTIDDRKPVKPEPVEEVTDLSSAFRSILSGGFSLDQNKNSSFKFLANESETLEILAILLRSLQSRRSLLLESLKIQGVTT